MDLLHPGPAITSYKILIGVWTTLFFLQMSKALFLAAVCLLQVLSAIGTPVPDPDYAEHKTVSEDTRRTSHTDSYSSYPDSGAAVNAASAYYAAPRAYSAYSGCPSCYYSSYSYPKYYSAPRYVSYAAPRYVSYSSPVGGGGVVDDNVYITDNLGRTTHVSKASNYRGTYYV